MAIEYCNLTTDLSRVYRDIEKYKNYATLTGWEQVGATNVWKLDQSGYIEMVYENGVAMTAGSNTTPSAGQFYYDTSTDILYIQVADSGNPSTDTIESGLSWNSFKQAARNDAQEMLEGWLRSVYAVPFQKVVAPGQSYNSRDYDYWVTRATALLTCYLIVSQTNPEDKAAELLYKQVYNEPTFEGEQPGIVQQILDGKIALATQRTGREAGGYNVYEYASNTATAYVIVTGRFLGNEKEVWRVQIDTSGAVGTATFKLSYDQGTNWDKTLQETRDTDSNTRRIHLNSGVYIEFVGTFSDGDYWDLELFPATDARDVQPFGTIALRY